jgi:glycosyltransferase involved in cell wall biosynthesis
MPPVPTANALQAEMLEWVAVPGTSEVVMESSRSRQLRVVHLSYSDIVGGAARAMYALHQGLPRHGIDSHVVVGKKASGDATVHLLSSRQRGMRGLPRRGAEWAAKELLARNATETCSFNLIGAPVQRDVNSLRPDVTHLHWIGDGFMRPAQVAALQRPIVWTLWDMWPFTGGCHYSWGCRRFERSCGACPILGSRREYDVTRWTVRRKARTWRSADLNVVAVSQWLAKEARRSRLFRDARIEVIPPGVDVDRFKPVDRRLARSILDLPAERPIVAFIALHPSQERRKGRTHLLEALGRLSSGRSEPDGRPLLLEVGQTGARDSGDDRPLPFPVMSLGRLNDDVSLALAYAASDLLVVPSVQEAFGRVAAEALACGTPVVAFRDTGVADAVEHGRTGYLAAFGSAKDLAAGMLFVLESDEQILRANARDAAVRHFSIDAQAKSYSEFYSVISGRKTA